MKLIYILPNLFTASSAFLGVISVIASSKSNFNTAIFFIVLSLILDGLDGRVARLTKSTSQFGVEFDSLADIIAFGVAPAMLFYFSYGYEFGKFGSLVCAMYVVFGAIRLARFNVMTGSYEPTVFIGLPIPSAAILLSFWVGIFVNYDFLIGQSFLVFIIILAALLMVSNIRYPSFKKVNFKKANFLKTLIALIVVFSLIYLYPLESATFLISIYVGFGILRAVFTILRKRLKKPIFDFSKNICFINCDKFKNEEKNSQENLENSQTKEKGS